MRRRARISKVAFAAVLTVAATVVAVSGVTADAAEVHRPLHAERPVSAAPADAPFGLDYFGLVADVGSRHPGSYGEVRFRHGRRWTRWEPLTEDGAQAAGTFTAGLVFADGADGYQVRGLPGAFRRARVALINTTDGPVVGHQPSGAAASAAPPCRSRADWNADESITAWTKGTDTPAFAQPQVLTVHHTAGSNDPNQDFAATVRAIEVYHVASNGWSDIGYQYLVDPNGVLYEGRYSGHTSRSCLTGGGDGSDFAHRASDDAVVTGAHVAGYNTGNVGVSLLGCFDDQAACSPGTYGAGDTAPSAAAVATLQDVLARLADRHGLDPDGTVTYANGTNTKLSPTITGHRDWESTACPGANLYARLASLRSGVLAALTPAQLTATPSASGVRLAWEQASAWPAVPEAMRYQVVRDDGASWIVTGRSSTDAAPPAGRAVGYTVTAIARDGGTASGSAQATATTAAPPPAGFTLTVSPSSDSTTAGTTRTATVTVTSSGETGPVSLATSVDRPGAGVTAGLDATSVPAGGSTVLRVAASPAATGSYVVTVTGTSTSGSASATYTVAVANRPPVVSETASCSGSRCNLTATRSDPDGGAVTLSWSLPGATPAAAGDTTAVSVIYGSPGTYSATVRGTDAAGLATTASRTITCIWTGKGKNRSLTCRSA